MDQDKVKPAALFTRLGRLVFGISFLRLQFVVFCALDPSAQGSSESVLGRSRFGINWWTIPRNP